MFKALKKSLGLKKRDGSAAKLQEQAAGDSAPAAVAGEAASPLVPAAAPAGLPLPEQQLQGAPPVAAAAGAADTDLDLTANSGWFSSDGARGAAFATLREGWGMRGRGLRL